MKVIWGTEKTNVLKTYNASLRVFHKENLVNREKVLKVLPMWPGSYWIKTYKLCILSVCHFTSRTLDLNLVFRKNQLFY